MAGWRQEALPSPGVRVGSLAILCGVSMVHMDLPDTLADG